MIDEQGRNINYLRLSVTDRCNLRCLYCMPENPCYKNLNEDRISDEEILRLVTIISKLGIEKVRITGGEPFVRQGIIPLISKIKSIENIKEIYATTNGMVLNDKIDELKAAGLDGLNISLDTLNEEKYRFITRGGHLRNVITAIDKAVDIGLKVKINSVIIEGMNEEDVWDLIKLAKDRPIDVRFIELMPIGEAKAYKSFTNENIKKHIAEKFHAAKSESSKEILGPASYIKLKGFSGKVGFISPLSSCFCEECNRIRVTSDGFLKKCLNFKDGMDLKEILRNENNDEKILEVIREIIYTKPVKHSFFENKINEDSRYMNQIGG